MFRWGDVILKNMDELIEKVEGKSVHITGSVNQVSYNSDNFSALDVTLSSIDGEKCSIRATITFEEYLKINESDTFSLVNYIYKPSGKDEYLRADGFYGIISCSSESELSYQSVKSADSILDIFKNANDKIQDFLNSSTDENTGALTGALLLGNRGGLRDEVLRDFRRCGISHIADKMGIIFMLNAIVLSVYSENGVSSLKKKLGDSTSYSLRSSCN